MPWNSGQGKFIRANPDFSGETVWQQDQQATIKIIAARHDSHDQDIADGISACLNLDGITSMRAELDLNNNKLINVAEGTGPLDGINKTQLDAVWNFPGGDSPIDYIDAGDAANNVYTDQEVSDINITSVGWNAAANTITLTKGDGTNVAAAISQFNQAVTFNGGITVSGNISASGVVTANDLRAVDIRSNGPITNKSQVFAAAAVVALQTLSSSRWTLTNNGATTLNFQAPTGSDPYLGENYEVEGTLLVTNGATPGPVTIQINGSPVAPADILGDNSTVANAKYLLSYIIHRAVGDNYNSIFIWSAVTS